MKLITLKEKNAGYFSVIAQGIEFASGKVVMQWWGRNRCIMVHDSFKEFESVYGTDNRSITRENVVLSDKEE